jgi:hypothetical protein
MNHDAEILAFQARLKADRRAALAELAAAVFDGFELRDLRAWWARINSDPAAGGQPFHELTGDELIETMAETRGWSRPDVQELAG